MIIPKAVRRPRRSPRYRAPPRADRSWPRRVGHAAAPPSAVPNSLGPAELLLHYGTEEQKNHYLPRLARGEEIPCFAPDRPRRPAPTPPRSRTTASCARATARARDVLGVRLNFDKRYITLAPVATVIGLAFRLYDPDRLLGDAVRTAASPWRWCRATRPGCEIGRRHLPLNMPFQNGPLRGKDVFVPLTPPHRRRDVHRPRLAHAGRVPVGRPRDLAALRRHRRRQDGGRRHRRLCPHPQAVRACRSAASRASRKRWRASAATPTPSSALSRHDRGTPSTRARSRRCPRRSPSTTPPNWAARSSRTRWTSTAARA